MLTNARLAAFVAAGAVVIAGTVAMLGLGGQARIGPTESPSTVPSAPPSSIAPTPAPAIVDLTLNSTFTSPSYRFSIGIATDWGVNVATNTWVGFDNSWPNVDRLEVTATDSVIDIGSQALAPGQSFDQWLEAYHADATANTPPGCDGGPISAWTSTTIDRQAARYSVGCNWTTAVVAKDDRVFTFTQRDTTADPTQHLRLADFLRLLRSVTLDAVELPAHGFPGIRGGPPGTYGWQGGPGMSNGMHWVVGDGTSARQAAAMTFSAGPGCLPAIPTEGATPVIVAGLQGLVVDPFPVPVTFGSVTNPTTRAYALTVGPRTLCVYVTFNDRTTSAERAATLAILDTIRAQPEGENWIYVTFELRDTWDTG